MKFTPINYHNKENDYIVKFINNKYQELENNSLKFTEEEYWNIINYLLEENGKLTQPYFIKPLTDNDYKIYSGLSILNHKLKKKYNLESTFNTNYQAANSWNSKIKKQGGNLNELAYHYAYRTFKDSHMNKIYLSNEKGYNKNLFNIHHILEGFVKDEEGYYSIYLSDFIHNTEYYNNLKVHNPENLAIVDYIQHLIVHMVIINILMDDNKPIAAKKKINLFIQFEKYLHSGRTDGFNGNKQCYYYLNKRYDNNFIEKLAHIYKHTYERFIRYENKKYWS